jgi:hypothetical protein
MEQMHSKNIFIEWLLWHFYEVPTFLISVWKNYILFALNYFSLPYLLKSLIAPWRKYRWNYPKVINIGEFFATFVSNVFSRLMGAIMRILLIIAGIFFQIFVLMVGFLVLLLWIFVPVIIIVALVFVFY